MSGVETLPLLDFVVEHPENFGLVENPAMNMTKAEAARGLRDQGIPKVFFISDGPLMQRAIAQGEMYKSSMITVTPNSLARKEVTINSTPIGHIDATRTDQLSQSLPDLMDQVWTCANFLHKHVPGFENATLSGVAQRIGIRETRRIVGECTLTGDDILQARKRPDAIAKGCHELDIHGIDTGHVRSAIKDGGTYDIPFGCLVPRNLRNVIVAGRCLSASREAHSSARVMGTCMAMGDAAGTAAAMMAQSNDLGDIREIPLPVLRAKLKEAGAVLDGIH